MLKAKEYWFYFTVANEFDAKAAVDLIESKGFNSYRQGVRVYHLGPLPDGLWRSIKKINTL